MAEIQAIYQAMARMAPPELAESWDNVGLLVNCGRPAARALTALDITPEVVEEARQLGCGVIVAHHPVIFSPLKRLDCRDVAFLLVQAGISAICMHTNLDAAEGGVNEVLAEILGIRDPVPFAGGCGRVGELDAVSPAHGARAGAAGPKRAGRPLRAAAGRACGAGQVYRQRQAGTAAGSDQRVGGQYV